MVGYNNMFYQQPYQPQYRPTPSIDAPQLKGRPVTSVEEVKAAQIDFDGSVFVFPDLANGKIYTKQVMLDGTAQLKFYSLDTSAGNGEQYVTKGEFEKAVSELREAIDAKHRAASAPDSSKSTF